MRGIIRILMRTPHTIRCPESRGSACAGRRASGFALYHIKAAQHNPKSCEIEITGAIFSLHVIKTMGCGRRQAEQLFKRHTGHSILYAIQKSRIEKAMTLLKSGNIPIEEIPSFCGYDSVVFFKTIFHRETGMTMREWRKRG